MAEIWFVEQRDGTVIGPMPEKQVCEDLLSGEIPGDARVRQGDTGPWCAASRVRDLFQQLANNGWYVSSGTQTHGPFTSMRLLELHRAGLIDGDAQLRQGPGGQWKRAADLFAVWAVSPPQVAQGSLAQHEQIVESDDSTVSSQSSSVATAASRQVKWSVEPVRHYVLPLEDCVRGALEDCQRCERLFLQLPERGPRRITVHRSNSEKVGSLSESNTEQLLANRERGMRHVALLADSFQATIALVLCPPGTTREDCRDYIDVHFAHGRVTQDHAFPSVETQ